MSRGILPSPLRSVLLVRLSARGDIVFASPLIRAFRRAHPDVKLVWLAESHVSDLIEHHPELDEVVVVERGGWKRLWKQRKLGQIFREARDLVRKLRSLEFDAAVDLQGLLRSGIWTYLSGAPVRIGLGSKEGSGIFMTEVLSRHDGDRRKIGTEYRHFAERAGLDVGTYQMEVPLAEEDRAWAEAKTKELGIDGGYCVAVPFTTTPQKHWREPRWADLIGRVRQEFNLPTVVLGGPGDEPALERIRGDASADFVSLVGETSLTQASAMVERASLVIGVDTGLSHMAIAFDRPTVTIFGSNIPYTKTPTPRAKVIVNWLDCSPCKGNPTCDGAFTCTEMITVEEVLATAREVLAAGEEHSSGEEHS